MSVKEFIRSSKDYFEQSGFTCQAPGVFPKESFTADLYAFAKGRSLGIFFPYEDHFFLHLFEDDRTNTYENISLLHEKAREYVNSRFPVPRALRYRVPNIVTVAVSERSFPPETARFASEKTPDLVGGERHSVFLVDLLQRWIVSQGREKQKIEGFSVEFKKVSPINRANHMVSEMVRRYDRTMA
jgi:hypothetical protein